MKYAQIRDMDVSNGTGIGIALYVQGCHFHCEECFNPETWSFENGNDWTSEVRDNFIKLADKDYISRITLLGGEPLCDENIIEVYNLIITLKEKYPDKKVWLYTGYTFEEIVKNRDKGLNQSIRFKAIQNVDELIDGRFMIDLKDLRLKFRGSSNQNLRNKEEIQRDILQKINK